MTLPRFEVLRRHWEKSPPVHLSAAAIAFGIGAMKPKSNTDAAPSRADMAKDLASAGIQIPGVKRG